MADSDPFGSISTMRLYGGTIAVVSGAYSIWLSTGGMARMSATAWLMFLVGIVVVVHGVALFTPAVEAIGRASGPLMIAYAVVMLLLQTWTAAMAPTMNGGMNGMGGGMAGMGADAGMVALAVVMLASGVIMTVRREMLP